MIPNNLMQPIHNNAELKAGTHFIHAPNDFTDYDELWAHVIVHGTTGAPTNGNIICTWQIAHPLSGGLYHDVDPTWLDLNAAQNSHLLHSGLDFPMKIARTVPTAFAKQPEYVRGIRLGTGRVRIKININFSGGTDPGYKISLALYARRSSADMKPMPIPKVLTANNTVYDYIRDVWGFSIRNKDAALAKVLLKDGSDPNALMLMEQISADGSVTKMFDRPVRFEKGVFLAMVLGGANGLDVILYTTDNMDS